MKKITVSIAIVFLASCLSAQVQLGKNVQVGGTVSGGVTSLNALTGNLSVTGDSSITITPSGTSIALHATGVGGSGVDYNPTTTAYIVASFSGLYDDGDSNSTNLGVPSSVSCSGGSPSTCTVAFAAAHGLSVGGAVDMFNLSAWPAGPAGSTQSAQYGSFQVTTVPDSTHITFTTPTALTYSCAPCTGNVYDASYWGIWEFARRPFIYGHGTVYGIESTTANLNTNFTTLTSGITGTPIYLIDVTGINDLLTGTTVATLETLHQSIWAKAHTAGMTVMQSTMPPAQVGLATNIQAKPGQFNYWLWQQTQTAANTSTGQYFDRYVDTASAIIDSGDSLTAMPDPQSNTYFADALNAAFSTQKTLEIHPPYDFTYTVGGIGGNVRAYYSGDAIGFYDSTWSTSWMAWEKTFSTMGIDTSATGNNSSPTLRAWNSGLTAGQRLYGMSVGVNATSKNSAFWGFNYAGSGSNSNYATMLINGGTDGFRVYGDGTFSVPSVATSASTAPVCPNGTNGTFTTTGCVAAAVSNVTSCGTTGTCSNAAVSGSRSVTGTVALAAGTATVTGMTAWTSTTSYVCTGTDQTAAAAVQVVNTSTTSITINGTGTDVIAYQCIGN